MASGTAKKAEELVIQGFPQKIIELDALLKTSQFSRSDFSEVHSSLNIPIPEPVLLNSHAEPPVNKKWKYENATDDIPGTKVMALPTGLIPCNKHMCELVHILKPHIRQLVEDANLIPI
ncbi:hypothetical protein J437_LFUL015825 [Ladona fulva]|uniref:Proteasome activator PA28 N-terminal domain-containing protein n=1 Tax=Ladona fulva TaxID=123851 RepID=A0A8K0KNA4_LADFU|nr:hypothetical protein J437_LFUL015825 [Ladona fulva]